MKTIQCEQGTPEWWLIKRGIPSASNFSRILTPKTMKLSASADDYACELIGDLSMLEPPEDVHPYLSRAVANGVQLEPEARSFYELESGLTVAQVGFIVTDDGRFGCSPDGLVFPPEPNRDPEGEPPVCGLELKCPTPKTQARYLLDRTLPDDYKAQVHGGMIVTGLQRWDFLSYCPGLDPFMITVRPDEYTEKLRAALESFWTRYQEIKAKVMGGAK